MYHTSLAVWVGGTLWGKLDKIKLNDGSGGLNFQYSPYATYPLSLSLPMGVPLDSRLLMSWFRNLLPEDKNIWNVAAKKHNVPKEWFQLLWVLGEDMPGNIAITPWNTELQVPHKARTFIDESTIYNKIKAIKELEVVSVPFGRLSLGGMQSKFSLGFFKGSWHISDLLNPSTHIFKPAPKRVGFEDIELLEHATMVLANRCGVKAANSSIYHVGGLTSYCVERFDRVQDSEGYYHRLWQEDLAQVLGVSRSAKYTAKPTDLTSRLRENGMPEDELYIWVSQVAFNVFVGNADAHSKNYSITRDSEGVPKFTPLYDSINLSTLPVKQNLAMSINGVSYSQDVTSMDWCHWGEAMGLDGDRTATTAQGTAREIEANYEDVYRSFGLDSFTYANIAGNLRGNL